jgi:hypothetical protein
LSETLLVDFSWSKPNAAALTAAGYSGVLGYISHDVTGKDLTAAQAKAYRKAGHLVGFVFESTADRAKGGREAGVQDCAFAEAEAAKRGYPEGCVLFYAVDFDVSLLQPRTWLQVRAYFRAVKASRARHGWGPYGSRKLVNRIASLKPDASWQTVAWSAGKVSKHADILQRSTHTRPIKGIPTSGWDEDVLLRPCPLWGIEAAPAPKPPKVKPLSRWQRALIRRVTRLLNATDDLTTDDRKAVAGLDAAALHALGGKP